MSRALILAGTGALGRASALRLLDQGWRVDVTGRQPERFSDEVRARGGRFLHSDRDDGAQLARAVGDGCDLIVDLACFSAYHARQLLDVARDATSVVMMSSKGVYADDEGRHVNSLDPPHFPVPIRESQRTVAPGHGEYDSREGYGANKVAAEHVLLESALPITVIRPSKVHGVDARRPREWYFVKRVLDARPAMLFTRGGASVDHPSAAVNVAALIEVVAAQPGRRVLNCADPDAPSVYEMARVIAQYFDYSWRDVFLDDDAPEGLGRSPWDAPFPIVLDTTAAVALGYVPVGDFASTVKGELEWLASIARRRGDATLPAYLDGDFFERFIDYPGEDRYLAALAGST